MLSHVLRVACGVMAGQGKAAFDDSLSLTSSKKISRNLILVRVSAEIYPAADNPSRTSTHGVDSSSSLALQTLRKATMNAAHVLESIQLL